MLGAEFAALPGNQLLSTHGDYSVAWASAAQIPLLLREIARLRETTFRGAGEGTGKALDLDRFDGHYLHLFVWHRAQQEVVGAYRMGQVDRILAEHGVNGLYTATLFQYDPRLIAEWGQALELGRSFIRAEYQRNFLPLLLLWRGIGEFVLRHPQYRFLVGPVSISNAYQSTSRHLLAADPRILEKYLGRDGLGAFRAWHAACGNRAGQRATCEIASP